jgi:hypothetical protein
MEPNSLTRSRCADTVDQTRCFGSSLASCASSIRAQEPCRLWPWMLLELMCRSLPTRNLCPLGIRRLSPTRASWLCGGPPDKLDEKQRKLVEQIRATHRDLDSAYQLSQAFVTMPSRTPGPGSGRLAHQSQTERYSRTEEFCGGVFVAITRRCALRIVDEIRRHLKICFAAFRGERELRPSDF